MLLDTHCHLDAAEFDRDREAMIGAARAVGVGGFLAPGVEVAGFPALTDLARCHPDIRLAYGIHPMYAHRAQPGDLDQLAAWLSRGEALAVGEIGLDGFVTEPPMALQLAYFVPQLELARDRGLPVVLHVRRAVEAVIHQLKAVRPPGGIAHAFNGSQQQAHQLMDLGFALGFGGAMTFPGSRRIRALAASLPLEAIVLETDAPDIPPAWAGGGRNEPANLARFATVLAELRGMAMEEVAAVTTANALRVLPGWARPGAGPNPARPGIHGGLSEREA
ncbi:MAG: TatD family hydrolase [Rhodocyclaceae bacterium]|jgi:TatD DNase family protein|nr:TatD family hydrolase [Rhodocyclaceae bacterium]